jgi:TonB family protein
MTYSSRQFDIIFLLSIIVHAVFLLELPRLRFIPPQKSLTNLEITYQKLKIEEAANRKLLEAIEKRASLANLRQNRPLPDTVKAGNPPSFAEKALADKILVHKVQTPAIYERPVKDIVKLPQASSPFIKNPAYINYYQIVRERIKSVARLDNPLSLTGEVFLTFILDANGQLRALRVVDEKSTSNPQLKNLAYSFIEKAAPFPVFPKNLPHQQLSFNVIIEFKISN